MPHEISSISGRDEVFTAGKPSWHGLGVNLPERVTSIEAIRHAGLDWKVKQSELKMVYHDPDNNCSRTHIVPDRVANYRDNEYGGRTYLATVGTRYVPIQNADAFKFLDEIVGQELAIYETAGAIKDGRRVWILLKLPEDMVIQAPGGEDRSKQYLLYFNSHDGTMTGRCFFTPVRVVCNNTLTWAMGRTGNSEGVFIRHTGNVENKISEAVNVLKIANAKYAEMGVLFNHLCKIDFMESEARDYFEAVWQDPTGPDATLRALKRREEERDRMMNNFIHGRGHDLAGKTLWGAYNAVTEWADHSRYEGRSVKAESRFESVISGSAARVKNRALEVASEIVPTGLIIAKAEGKI